MLSILGRRRLVAPVVGLLAMFCIFLAAAACSAAEGKVYKKGGVRLYLDQKRIEMDGRFVLAEGPIELFACAAGGKEYESILSLDVNPEILHFCLVLMGLKPGERGPKFQGDPDQVPTGSPVTIRVKWMDGDAERVCGAEDLCWNAIDQRSMEPTPWVFAGSRKERDTETGKVIYWANVEKTIIAVYRDPFAVLDLPLPLGANDEAYVVNTNVVPAQGTRCTVILEPAPGLESPPKNAAGGAVLLVDVSRGGRTLLDGAAPLMLPDDFHLENRDYVALERALKKRMEDAPKDTCRVTVDQGAPAATAAMAFEVLAAVGVQVESVQTVREDPDKKVTTVVVTADGEMIGVETDGQFRLSDDGTMLESPAEPDYGVDLHVAEGTTLETVAKALRACAAAKEGIIHITWPAERPSESPQTSPAEQ